MNELTKYQRQHRALDLIDRVAVWVVGLVAVYFAVRIAEWAL